MCGKVICGLVVLVLGILFLLKDLGINYISNIQPWTVVFLLAGACILIKGCCKCKGKK